MTDWDRCAEISAKIKGSSGDVSFLSEIVIDEEDQEYIIKNAMGILFSDNPSSLIPAAYIMVIAGRSFDRSYWPHLYELIRVTDLNNDDKIYLRDKFREGMKELGLDKDIETKRNVEQYLIHTVVPDKEEYMNNFFSFISSFYKDVLKFELPDDYSEPFELLSAIVNGEVQDDQFPSTYALNECTKYALKSPQYYDKIMIKILNIIDAGYKGRKISGLGNNRFAIPFQKWYMDNIGSRSRSSLRKEMEMRRARVILYFGKVRILIPAMRCTSNASLIIKSGRKIVKEVPIKTFPSKVQGTVVHKMANDLFLNPKEFGIDPFEKYQIEIDGHSVLSSSARDFLLFNEDGIRINSLNIGINHILVKDVDTHPECNTANIYKEDYDGLYVCNLKEGDELVIGETHLSVMPADSTSEGINITPLENVTAVSDMEIMPVCSDFDILCFISNVDSSSKIYARITIDDAAPYHRPLNVSPSNIFNKSFVSRLLKDEQTENGIHTVFVELYHNNNKIDDSKFLLVPGYKYQFDSERPVYVEETKGSLELSGPIFGTIDFSTEKEYVDVSLPESNIKIRHKVPALRIRTGDNIWHSPGSYDMNINEFIGDYLWVSSICASSLYHNKKPIPRHVADDCYMYDFHKIHEMYDSDNICNVEVEVSLESKPRFHLCNIWVCNEYETKETDDSIEISVIRHTSNKIIVRTIETNDEFELEGNSINVRKPDCNLFTVVIEEKDEYGTKHTIISKKFMKNEIYLEKQTETSCNLVCFGNVVPLEYKEKTISEIMRNYDSKSRFSPWMKEHRSKVINYLKSVGFKQ